MRLGMIAETKIYWEFNKRCRSFVSHNHKIAIRKFIQPINLLLFITSTFYCRVKNYFQVRHYGVNL